MMDFNIKVREVRHGLRVIIFGVHRHNPFVDLRHGS